MNTDKTNTDKDNDMDNFKNIISDSVNQKKIIQIFEKNAPENKTNDFKDALNEFKKDNNNEDNIINIAKLLVAIKDDVDKQKITGGKKHKTRKYKKKGKKKTMKKKGKKKTMKKRGKKSRK